MAPCELGARGSNLGYGAVLWYVVLHRGLKGGCFREGGDC